MRTPPSVLLVALLFAAPAVAATPAQPVEGEVMLPASGAYSPMVMPGSSDVVYRSMIAGMVGTALERSDFAWLDKKAAQYLHERTRTPIGDWSLSVFYEQFDVCGCDGSVDPHLMTRLEQKTLAWAKEFPNSPAPHIAYAMVLEAHAWTLRGTGYAETVTPEGWQLFRDYMTRAAEYLRAHRKVAAADPQYYVESADTAAMLGATRAQWQAIEAQGLDRFSDYLPLYMAAASLDLPKWGGDPDMLDDLVDDAVRRTHKDYGAQFYSLIYARLANNGELGPNPFASSRLDWPHLLSSYLERLALRPEPSTYSNVFFYACLAGDKVAGRLILPNAPDQTPGSLWESQAQIDQCKAWVKDKADTPSPLPNAVDLRTLHRLTFPAANPIHASLFTFAGWLELLAGLLALFLR